MPGRGTGIPTQISINAGAVVVAAPYAEGFSVDPAPESYESAALKPVRRGSGVWRVAGNLKDYSAFATLAGYMTGRTAVNCVVTYVGGGTLTLNPCRVKVLPTLLQVQGVQEVFLGTSSANLVDLDAGTGWTSLGMALDDITVSFETNDHTSGRVFYYSWIRASSLLMLPDITPATITGASFTRQQQVKLALKFGDNLWLVLDNVRLDGYEDAAQDGNRPLCTELAVSGTHTAPASLFSFHNGSAAAVTEPGDFIFGFDLEVIGAYLASQADTATFA